MKRTYLWILLFVCIHPGIAHGIPKSPHGFIRDKIKREAPSYLCMLANLKNQAIPLDEGWHRSYLQERYERAMAIVHNDITDPEKKQKIIETEGHQINPLYMILHTIHDLHYNPYSKIRYEYSRMINRIFEYALCIKTGCHSGNQHDHDERVRVVKHVSLTEREEAIKEHFSNNDLDHLRFSISQEVATAVLTIMNYRQENPEGSV